MVSIQSENWKFISIFRQLSSPPPPPLISFKKETLKMESKHQEISENKNSCLNESGYKHIIFRIIDITFNNIINLGMRHSLRDIHFK